MTRESHRPWERRESSVGRVPGWLLAMGVLALLLVGAHAARQALTVGGSTDLHAYWYAGHFVREGRNPYVAQREGAAPEPAPGYAFGAPEPTEPVRRGDLAITASNTAPVTLLLSTLAWLSWPAAKVAWLATNVALALLAPVLVLRLLPHRHAIPASWQAAFILGFLALQGTRISVWVGQTTLLVFALALGALALGERRWRSSGILLGLAVSKVSLAAPVWVFFAIGRRARAAAVALGVQLLGLALVAGLDGWDVPATLEAYAAIARLHAGLPGIHLAGLAPGTRWLGVLAAAGLTAAVAAWLWRHRARWRPAASVRPTPAGSALPFEALHVLVALVLWGLLVVYHRAYDTLAAYLFAGLVLDGLAVGGQPWRLDRRSRRLLAALALGLLALLAFPPSLVAGLLPHEALPAWYRVAGFGITGALLLALALTLVLLGRLPDRHTARDLH